MRPLIGISQCLDERGRWHPTRETAYLDTTYAGALAQSGATPILLPLQEDVDALAERLDGLLIPGGGDFPPPHAYPPEIRFETIPSRQLAFDQSLLSAAFARRLPVLAICYGMQLLAIQTGGRLLYDIPSDLTQAPPLAEPGGRHELIVELGRGSRACWAGPGP
jgi:putative glutamine amidotransferase